MTRAEISSRMFIGAQASPDTMAKLSMGMEEKIISFCVFETHVGHKKVHCCWSGGRLNRDGTPELTAVGQAALEALCRLPNLEPSVMIFAEVKLGVTPLQWKVKRIILDAPEGAFICFVGDLANELDGHMGKAFNLTGEPIFLPIAEGLKA